MHKVLLDSSTFFDIRRATKKGRSEWAQNTLRNLLAYQARHKKLTVSAFRVFEFLDGLHRAAQPSAIEDFYAQVIPSFEVIYPDQEITALAANINASLSRAGQGIGIVDTFIAATAIRRDLALVNANTKHFPRVQAAGFPIVLLNGRVA